MLKETRILISNIGLPSKIIGSWSTRLSKFITNNPDFFDYILSPEKEGKNNIFCQKKNFITWSKKVRNLNLKHWVAKDYLNEISNLSKKAKKITIVVLDDAHLLEAIALEKNKFKCEIKLIFSFHGFSLNLNELILNKIDKVLFLTNLSYEDALKKNETFTPEVEVIGNGVDSSIFYPLQRVNKIEQKNKMEFNFNDQIICWMSNSRRKKGLHIFIKIIDEINKLNVPVKFIIIGSNIEINKKNVSNIGRISNHEMAKYLQISDYYFFTSLCKEGFGLSLLESIKCGVKVITSNNGGIPEVIQGLDNITVVKKPNIISEWVEAFVKSYHQKSTILSKEDASKIWSYKDWEEKFKKSIL
ncbi:glycosyltransferase family 4 protein [Polaribacter marinaquae]|uniref:Glycosyltransferase family 4 protein n=1 Tax=Polaribacter marinaquae TaxID=1642819 RepID=A0ABZ2TWZ4_9FLAO